MANAINWFEIPTVNFDRAMKFYEEVLDGKMQEQNIAGIQMAFLPLDGQGVGGAICKGDGYVPSETGALVYLNGGNDLSGPLSKVEPAGGSVLMPKTKISDEIGFMAIFKDVDGNKLAFHSPQ